MVEASRLVLLACAALLVNVEPSSARFMQRPHSDALLVRTAAACFGGKPVPTGASPIHDPQRIARMRKAGQLPDSFVCGRCRYDLAGDPGAAYYIKTCR